MIIMFHNKKHKVKTRIKSSKQELNKRHKVIKTKSYKVVFKTRIFKKFKIRKNLDSA